VVCVANYGKRHADYQRRTGDSYALSGVGECVGVGGGTCSHRLGDVNGDGALTIADATEILIYLARLDTILYDYDNEQIKNHCAWNAALIISNREPTIDDVNIILAFLAGEQNILYKIWRQ
jgi:hypothetical protein